MILKNKVHHYKKTALKRQNVYEREGDGFCVGCYICGDQLHNAEQIFRYNCEIFPVNCKNGFYSKALNTFFVNDGFIYRYDFLEGSQFMIISKETYGDVFFIEYLAEDGAKVASCTGSNAYIYDGSEVKTVQFPHSFKSGVYNFGRFFFADDTAVYWTGLGGIEDWEQGISASGCVNLENLSLGKIMRLVVMGDKLVVVRECGFTVIRAFGSPENFKVDNVNAKCHKINEKSVAVAQNKVYYFSDSGMFLFDGNTVKAINCVGLNDVKEVGNACASQNCYYVYSYVKKLNSYAILCVQLDFSSVYYLNCKAPVLSFGERLYALGNGGMYSFNILEEDNFNYTSKPLNFSAVGNKVLRYICLPDDSEGEITVKSEVCERSFSAKKCIRVNMAGDSFILHFKGKCNALKAVAVAEV